jgi:hypothetical protein
MSATDVNQLFAHWPDADRDRLWLRVIAAPQLPAVLRDPDASLVARGFAVFMTRPRSSATWASLPDILNTLVINEIPVGVIPDVESAIYAAMLSLSQ